jgi:hypothetical protein
MGFASRAQLNRHTRKYHAQFDDETSLADEVRALKKRRVAEEITKHKKTSSMSAREISPQLSSASGLSSPPRSSPEPGSPSAQFANQSKISPFLTSKADGASQYENVPRGFPESDLTVLEKIKQNRFNRRKATSSTTTKPRPPPRPGQSNTPLGASQLHSEKSPDLKVKMPTAPIFSTSNIPRVNDAGQRPSPVKTTKRLSLSHYKAARMKKRSEGQELKASVPLSPIPDGDSFEDRE